MLTADQELETHQPKLVLKVGPPMIVQCTLHDKENCV